MLFVASASRKMCREPDPMVRYEDELYYFQYAPPLDRLEDASRSNRPSLPFATAEPWQCSVYYFWWLFLKENDDYHATHEARGVGPCARVYNDFGDIYTPDFPTWWMERGRDLFCEPRSAAVQLTSPDQLLADAIFTDRLVLTIDQNSDVDRVLAEVRSLMRMPRSGLGRARGSQALYPVFTKPVLTSLHQHHQVYELARDNPSLPMSEIGRRAGLMPSIDPTDADSRATLASVTARTLRQARMLIKNVARGVFPVSADSHDRKVDSFLDTLQITRRLRVSEIISGPYETEFGRGWSRRQSGA
jgi:hypothetical protein